MYSPPRLSAMAAIERWLPKSLLGRMLLTLSVGILFTQAAVTLTWTSLLQAEAEEESVEAAKYLGQAAASTAQYFATLPASHQPLVIDQLLDMGGGRFFFQVNEQLIEIDTPPTNRTIRAANSSFHNTIIGELGPGYTVHTALAWPQSLAVDEVGTLITQVPRQWTEFSILLQPKPAPLMVAQVQLNDNQWLYLAGLMPDPYFLDKARPLNLERLTLQIIPLLTVLFLLVPLVRSVTGPLAGLARAAESFGKGLQHDPLPEHGSEEFLQLRQALLSMEARIQAFLSDRQRLFSAISHDLRTPITRLKLRTEFIEDDEMRESLHEDLDDLAKMVTGALMSVKETALDELPEPVAVEEMLNHLIEGYRLDNRQIELYSEAVALTTKPLALKRAIDNLLNNALTYGKRVEVRLYQQLGDMVIHIRDFGPGVPEAQINFLFRPGVRLNHGRDSNHKGLGLGLSITSNLIKGLGGTVTLKNHSEQGLIAEVRIPFN